MPLPHLGTELSVIQLFKLEVEGLQTFYFQNYQLEDYAGLDGNLYEYIGLSYSGPSRTLELNNQSAEITLRNSSASQDSLQPVRNLLREHEGFTGGIVEITTIHFNVADGQPYTERLQIASSEIGEEIKLTLESPINAVDGVFPRKYFGLPYFRELPSVRASTV